MSKNKQDFSRILVLWDRNTESINSRYTTFLEIQHLHAQDKYPQNFKVQPPLLTTFLQPTCYSKG